VIREVLVVLHAGRPTNRYTAAAVARRLAADGARVVLAARREDRLAALAAEIEGAGGRALPWALDVAHPATVGERIAALPAEFAEIDVLVNNAGITLDRKTTEVTDEDWETVLATNLTSMFRCARAVAPGMMRLERGKIINIGSMYGVIGVPRYAAYCASKAAVDGLTRSLAAEWARHGIQVNCLAPGYVNTDIPRAAMADARTRELFLSKVPARRIGEPDEVGALAVYLASPASDFMTGQTVYLDGGQTMAW
jgi:2-deoxy-D-gluconate 3-dehydrogenase